MAISGKRIILANNQALRAKDQNGDVQELLKLDAAGQIAGKVKEYIDSQNSIDQGEITTLQSEVATLNANSSTAGSVDFKVAAEAALREAGDTATLSSAQSYADAAVLAADDVKFYDNLAAFPAVGDEGVIYTDKDTNKIYRFREVIVPGSFDHVVGPTGDFATLQDALASPLVENGDSIQVQAGTYVVASTITISKQVQIFGEGKTQTIFQTAGAGSDPVTMISVTADNVVLKGMAIKHRKSTNSSIESAVVVSGGAWPTFSYPSGFIMDDCRVEYLEFGIVIRGNGFKISNNEFAYATGSVSNSNRCIGHYGQQGNCFIVDNVFDNSVINSTAFRPIYSTSTNASSNETVSGKLIIQGNTHLGLLQQFYNQDNIRGSAGDFALYIKNNTTNETSLFAGLYVSSANQLDLFSEVVLQGNSISNNHDAATGTGKGMLAIDGVGSSLSPRSAALPVHASGNTLAQLVFRADYLEATGSSGSLVGYKPSVFTGMSVNLDSIIPSFPSVPATPSGSSSSVTQEYVELSASASLSSLESRMSAAEADIDQLEIDVAGKAAQSALDALELRVDTAESDVDQLQLDVADKASQADLDALELRVDGAESDIDQLELDMATKASQADLDLAESDIDQLQLDVAAKASQADLDLAESDIDQLQLDVAAKLDSSLKGAANGVAELDATGKVPASQLPSISSVEAVKMSAITLTAQQVTDGYLDLTHDALSGSISVFCERVAILEGLDYTVSTVGGVSRLTWIGPSAAGADEEFAEGDIVYIQYLRQV